MKRKYSVGDFVMISKIFVCDPHGRYKDIEPTKAKIIRIVDTRTYGPAYTLRIGVETLSVCYWTDDIDYLIEEDPDAIWKIFGDQ
jgi:hypothetical protein